MKGNTNKPIAIWLYFGAFTIFLQIILGGITRLSGSGLSITEWKPLMGFLPPLNENDWQLSFDKYKQIAQFHVVNAHFSLEDYKSIYFWEWFHRNWARFIGLGFIFPFFYFAIKRKMNFKLRAQIFVLFLLGLLQAVIGWLMVQSGLNDTDISVSHIRLAIHFVAAVILLCYTLWLAFTLSLNHIKMRHRLRFSKLNIAILAVLFMQLIYGAFMAGTHAALAAPTWPDMNGFVIPTELQNHPNTLSYLTGNLLAIQFIHRSLAYVICLLVLVLYLRSVSWKINSLLSYIRLFPLLLVGIQVISGIMALLKSIGPHYSAFALFHQFTGILLTVSLLLLLFLNLKKN
ncbi:cytochrome c oxidase assembly protein subunit 15 [Pedobacter steynii]|uniref:Cytochrome c oxidase assembly protein subunit 15 n=1 Tax=Pedobacter steynii TaxID=430522 RepID=A0A1H0MLK5_9SPHI|nr:COX15/CtaA family protein [Pedobacter steynii]NQX43673.1 COX15/CtaA family protein [Pedobacter steynii]SDO81185.1 cytochrome c oxidase assembly protein subunit 15 [Pedobacter steynii]